MSIKYASEQPLRSRFNQNLDRNYSTRIITMNNLRKLFKEIRCNQYKAFFITSSRE
jgi:hypothetical protein